MQKGDHPNDPRGLIREAYRIEDISAEDCRTILFDWALGPEGAAGAPAIRALLEHYRPAAPEHPMTRVLEEGLGEPRPPRRRGRRGA